MADTKKVPKEKKEIGRIILPAIKRLQNKIEQSHWVQKLSEKLGVSSDSVLEELSRLGRDRCFDLTLVPSKVNI